MASFVKKNGGWWCGERGGVTDGRVSSKGGWTSPDLLAAGEYEWRCSPERGEGWNVLVSAMVVGCGAMRFQGWIAVVDTDCGRVLCCVKEW